MRRRSFPERLSRAAAEHELRRMLDVPPQWSLSMILATLGLDVIDRELLAMTLRHESRSRSGESLSISRGRRSMRIDNEPPSWYRTWIERRALAGAAWAQRSYGTPAPSSHGPATYRGSRMLLGTLADAIENRAPDADRHIAVALVLLLLGLDDARVLRGERAAAPPTGGARVRWLAIRVRDLLRDPRSSPP